MSHFSINVTEDSDGSFVATVVNLPGCFASGTDLSSALRSLGGGAGHDRRASGNRRRGQAQPGDVAEEARVMSKPKRGQSLGEAVAAAEADRWWRRRRWWHRWRDFGDDY